MAFILADRVKETTTTTGTSSVVLGGTIDASKTFSAAIGDGNSTYYCIESPDGNFEVGIGTYTSATNSLSRDTIISSSNSGSKISLVGVSNVFCTQPGPKAVFINDAGLVSGVNTNFEGFAFPDGTIQYTSATSGNAPITIERQGAGVFFNYFINNAYDETVSLHLEDEQYPRFKLGLRDTAEGNSAPTYGYLFGEQGYAGGVGDSTCEFYVANNNGFWIKHNSQNIANFAQDDGIIFQNVAAASPTFTVKGNAAQAADLQRWNDSSSTTLAKVTKEGHVSGVELHTPTISFADGTTQTTAGYTGTGDINVNQYIYHEGDSNTYIRFRGDQIDFVAGNVTMLTLDETSQDIVKINDGGNDVDFQVEGDNDANLIRTDAANDRVGIGTDSPSYLLDVAGSGSFEGIRFSDGTTQATSFAADVATASGALRADITTNTAAIPASGYAISGALQSQIDSLGGASISYVDAATASGVANSGFFSRELHEISGVGGLIANKSNWDTAYGWGDHSSAGYLTSQTSHADVLVDGDFSSQGLMKRGFSGGSYSIVTDNSSNWNTAYGWGDHSAQSYTNLSYVSGIVANSGYAISGALQLQIDGISGGSDSFTSESGVAHSGFFSEELHEVSGVGGLITSTVANSGYHISGVLQPQITANTTAIPASGYHISGVLQPQITTNTTAIPASGYHISGVLQPQITTNAAAIPASGYHISGILQTQITNLNHDTLTGFVANEHIDWTADQGSTNIHTGNYDNTTYTAGSGIELQAGTEFNVAISGNNILSTNTPSDNYVPSYDLDSGKFTWVENTGGGGEANQNAFSTVSVATQTDVVADSATDTLTLAAGSNVTITTNAGTDTVTIAATDTNTMGSGFTVSATTDSNATTITQGDDLMFAAGAGITCETTADGTVTISCTVTDTNTTYSAATSSALGLVKLEDDTEQSVAANAVSATASRTYGIQLNSSDQAVVNVPWTDTNTNTMGSGFTVSATTDTTATTITEGEDLFFAAGTGITCETTADGTVTIACTVSDTNTTYTAGDGLDLGGTEFSVDLKANGGLVIESTEIAVDLGASSITGTLAAGDGGTGLTSIATLLNSNNNIFKTISVSGQDDVVADSATDTLTLAAGSNVTITTTAGADTITIAAADTNTMGSGFTVSATTDSNATTITQGDDLMFAAGTGITCETTADGTVTISSTVTDTNTMGSGFTVSATTDSNATTITQGDDLMFAAGTGITCETTADGTVTISSTVTDTNTMGSGFTVSATTDTTATTITQGDDLMFAAGTGITCETTADGTVTISCTVTNTNTQLSTEEVQDIVGGMVTGNTETGITVTYVDDDGTLDFAIGTLNQSTTGSAATLTTARAIALGGDVTGTANFDGSAGITITSTIANDAVTYAKMQDTSADNRLLGAASAGTIGEVQVATDMVADDAITYAKIQNVSATNRILGRDSAGAGVIEEISPADLRTMLNVADGATAAGTVTAINNATANELVTIGSTTTELDAQANLTFDGSTLTLAGVADITDTTDASDATGDTGALRCEGGASIAKKLYVGTNLDVDGTTNLDAVDIDGNVQIDGTLTVGVNDTGKDVKFFGATAGSYLEWDESADRLHLVQGAFVNQPVPATGGTNSGTTLQIDLSRGNYHNITLNGHVAVIEFQNATIGQKFIIRFTQESTARTVFDTGSFAARINGSVAAELKWAGNVVPTMSTSDGHKDVYGFLCTATGGSANDTKFDGFIIGQDIPD